MSAVRHCPAVFISAPASGQGKTTVTSALAWKYRQQGLDVRVFKTGADFIDPMILQRASGNPVYQLDLWMGGDSHCRHLLYEAAGVADLILIEGVMGLFDGKPSSADLAARFDIPVLSVIDASAMAQTFGALLHGLAHYRHDVRVYGAIANRVGGERHAAMLRESVDDSVHAFGWLAHDINITLPERHLGLIQSDEITDLDRRLERAAAALTLTDLDFPQPCAFSCDPHEAPSHTLKGVNVAVAHDTAFSFVYRANLDTLSSLGANLLFFSPLRDTAPPPADALYLPGGYPELHLAMLTNNGSMRAAIRAHHKANKPILAECGGMLYLLESLTDVGNQRADMLGVLPGHAALQPRLSALALQEVSLPEGKLRGHTYHYSRLDTPMAPIALGACPNGNSTAEAVYRIGRTTASYVHHYFPSNPDAVARLFTP